MTTNQFRIIFEKTKISNDEIKIDIHLKLLAFDEEHRDIAVSQLASGLPIVDWKIENIVRNKGFISTQHFLDCVANSAEFNGFVKSDFICRKDYFYPGEIYIQQVNNNGTRRL